MSHATLHDVVSRPAVLLTLTLLGGTLACAEPPEPEVSPAASTTSTTPPTAPSTTTPPSTTPPTTTPPTTTGPEREWFPGVYLPRHCPGSSGSGFVSEADADSCRADLMMGINMHAEVIRLPESSEQVYGVSQYLRIFDFAARNPDTGQFGIWGQWIGSLGAHPNGAFNSIEGGLFIQDKMGRSRFPKYMASAATHLYSSDSDTGSGWGFQERRIDCSVLGRLTLSNRMLVPPNLIAFDEQQDTHDDEGGIFVGTSWVALPLIGGETRVDGQPHGLDGGLMTWTFFIDAANHSGPLVAYVPEHWSRRVDRWNATEVLDDVYGWNLSDPIAATLAAYLDGEVTNADLHAAISDQDWYGGSAEGKEFGSPHWVRQEDTLGYSPARGYLPTGIEMPPIPAFLVDGVDGRTFIKVFPPLIPTAADREGLVLNVQTFDVDLYNHFVDVFTPGADLSGSNTAFDGLGTPMQVESWDEEPWPGIEVLDLQPFDDPYETNLLLRVPLRPRKADDETDVFIEWGGVDADQRGWAAYYEIVDGQAVEVASDDVPSELLDLEYATRRETTSLVAHDEEPDGYDFSCWVCDDRTTCDDTGYETVADDGSRISYRWYRFRDQPALRDLRLEYPDAYSEANLTDLQSVVEAMHREWGGTQQFLERPTNLDTLHLAEIDHALLVEPPAGKEHGWVPIVTQVELPDGVWQTDVDYRELGDGRLVLR